MPIAPQEPTQRQALPVSTPHAIYTLTAEGEIATWNAEAERTTGYAAAEVLGKRHAIFYTAADRALGVPARELELALKGGFEGEGWRQRADGVRLWTHTVLQPMRDARGVVTGIVSVHRDTAGQRQLERRAKEQERHFHMLVQSITDYAIYMLAPDGTVSSWNAGAARAKGYRAEEIVGQHFSRFYLERDRQKGLPARVLETALERGKFEGEGWRVRKDGSKFWAHVVIHPVRDEDGTLIGFAKVTRDVTEKKRIEDQVTHLAHHDALTSLLNRASFREEVERVRKRGRHCVLLYLDLDRFKPINDTLGHLVGDKVLQVVADRIARQLRKSDVGGRLGGDEFAILLVDCDYGEEATAASQRLIREIEKPIQIDSLNVSVGVSVGIASLAEESSSTEMLLRNADLALYAAKREERGTYRWYEPGMESVLLKRKALESDLRLALIRDEFLLHYQPIVRSVDGVVTGYEALIRWKSPTRGDVPPAEFIPFAEEHGLMGEIGEWVLKTACSAAAQWPKELSISVNLSPAQFRAPNLVEKIGGVLEATGLAAERLELEITETAMMGNISAAKVILDELRAKGVMVAMDDFGTGYSSLSFLRMLPFTRIKIDRSFIQDLGRTQESLAIVRAVTGLCSSLGVATTAEGVETDEQRRILQREGCHDLQGYLLGRPTAAPVRSAMDAPGDGSRRAMDAAAMAGAGAAAESAGAAV